MLRLFRQNSDGRAVARVLNGDANAFGLLVDRYGRAALAVARAIAPFPADAEDVLQEAYVLAYRKLDTLEQPHRFGPWLISITRNVALRARERARDTTPLEQAPEAALGTAPAPERAEIRAVVRHALESLDPDHREVLLMHYFAGNTVAEIANMLDISTAAAKKRLQRARESLSKDLLKALGTESAAAYGLTPRRRAQILAAVAAGGAAWQGTAHAASLAAASTGAASLALKAVVTMAALGAIVTTALVAQRTSKSPETRQVVAAPAATAPNTKSTETTTTSLDEAALLAAFNATGTLPTGSGSIDADLKSILGLPVSGATANLERVTWNAAETPPARVPMWNSLSDDEGHVHFENLPLGEYSLVAYTETAGTAESFYLSARHPYDSDDNVVLMPLQQMDGHVVNTAGEPVGNATIYPIAHEIEGNDEFSHLRVAAARTASDASGAFHFDRVWPGKMRFFVAAKGYAPYKSDWVATNSAPVFTLDQGGTLDLTLVRAPGGEPLAGIPLTLTDDFMGRFLLSGTTDAVGTLHFDRVAPGNYVPSLDDAALTLVETTPIAFEAKAQLKITIEASAGATIYGKVTESDTGEPLPGLVVLAQTEPEREAITSDDGTYMLIGVPAGEAQIGVAGIAGDRLRHYPSGAMGYSPGNTAYRRVPVAQGETIEEVNFDMRRANVVRGRVIDAQGAPAPNADVNIRRVECPADERHIVGVNADEDGNFVINELLSACSFEIFARNATGISKFVAITPDAQEEYVLQLSPDNCTYLAGTAQSPDGMPITSGTVSLTFPDHVIMGEDIKGGRVDFGMVPTGKASYTVQYAVEGRVQYGCPAVDIELPAGKRLDKQVFGCGPKGDLSISGHVLLPDGGPAVGATVTLFNGPQRATTDAQGGFVLNGLSDTDYHVDARLEGYTADTMNAARGGDSDLALQLAPIAQLSGHVISAEDGTPIEGARVDLHDQNSQPIASSSATSAEDGSFAFDTVALGSIILITNRAGYAMNRQDLYLESEGALPVVVISLARPAEVAGVVVAPDGTPLPEATLSAARSAERSMCNAQGQFVLRDLEAGVSVPITVTHPEYGKRVVDVVPGAPGSDALRIEMEMPPTLELTVTRGGVPVPRFDVNGYSLTQPNGGSFLATGNSPDGLLTTREVSPGTWNIYIRCDNGEHSSFLRVVEFAAGQVTTLSVDFQVGTAHLEGQLVTGFDLRETGLFGQLVNVDERFPSFDVHLEGNRFHAEDLVPGTYELRFMGGQNPTWRLCRRVQIAEGEMKEFDFVQEGGASFTLVRSGSTTGVLSIELDDRMAPPDLMSWTRNAASREQGDGDTCVVMFTGTEPSISVAGLTPGAYWMTTRVIDTSGTGVPVASTTERIQIAPGDANEVVVGE